MKAVLVLASIKTTTTTKTAYREKLEGTWIQEPLSEGMGYVLNFVDHKIHKESNITKANVLEDPYSVLVEDEMNGKAGGVTR